MRVHQITILLLIIEILLQNLQLTAQDIKKDSQLQDTIGISSDLKIIAQKLGPLPDSIYRDLTTLKVRYYGFTTSGATDTTTIREGILVLGQKAAEDLKNIFEELLQMRFPIAKVIPINRYGLNADTTGWNDAASMEDNNCSAFNYRYITHSTELSPHAFGTAIDFNPLFNPYEKYAYDGKFVEPADAFYDKSRPGTILDDRVVGLFDKRGWVWGGRWNNPVDYQHFDLRMGRGRKHYLMKHSALKDWFRYGEKDNSIAIYASVAAKKMEQIEILLTETERSRFSAQLRVLGADSCYKIWTNKKDTTVGELPMSLPAFDSLKNDKKMGRLSGLVVAVYPDNDSLMACWNRYAAAKLEKMLQAEGATVHRLSHYAPENHSNYHLAIGIGIGNRNMYLNGQAAEDDFQVIYVPGAYKFNDLEAAASRFHFLQLLVSDDLPKSVQLAACMQEKIKQKMGLKPVSRQLRGPNFLETDCIKTDIDGVYCRNSPLLNRLACPQVFVSPYSLNKTTQCDNWLQPKTAFSNCEKLAEACFEGILEYIEY
jgi:hypothetical protein